MIEIKTVVMKEVEETLHCDLKPYWSVRVLRPNGVNTYFVEYEERFEHEPTDEEIATVLVEHQTREDSFASVVKNYWLVEVGN